MAVRRTAKVSTKTLSRRGRLLYTSLSTAVDLLNETEKREKALASGESENRADLESTYPALKGGAR